VDNTARQRDAHSFEIIIPPKQNTKAKAKQNLKGISRKIKSLFL